MADTGQREVVIRVASATRRTGAPARGVPGDTSRPRSGQCRNAGGDIDRGHPGQPISLPLWSSRLRPGQLL